MGIVEITIKHYSGLSSVVKPTIGAGNTVPNGSRWREVDTGKTFFFNLADDAWYDLHESANALEGMVKKSFVQDNNSETLLSGILKELKKMNIHLSLITDNNITNAEVDNA